MPLTPAPLTTARTIVVISDRVEGWPPREGPGAAIEMHRARLKELGAEQQPWTALTPDEAVAPVEVVGGYLERLPLSLIATGAYDRAEIWHHYHAAEGEPPFHRGNPRLAYRAFHADHRQAPMASADMRAFIETFGAPHLLVVYGLGVDEALLELCANSVIIYNSIDAPPLRVPPEVSRHFDLILTGADWQSQEVAMRHPDMPTLVLPVGPEFAGEAQFRPLGSEKRYDLVYVAAAQPYKRHDLLLDAIERSPRPLSALCVFGYGELADHYRHEAQRRELAVDFVGPPGVGFEEVNRLMNLARIGVVAGYDDGAPAIITEYMLAGLPVLANAGLVCGRQYITPLAGRCAVPADWPQVIAEMLDNLERFRPREQALAQCHWRQSSQRLLTAIRGAKFP